MSKKRRVLAFVVALALYTLALPISAFAATPTTIKAGNSSEFNEAVATVNAATSGEYIIKLTDDFQTGGASFSSSQPVSIVGNGHTITFGGSSIYVNPSVQLSLGAADGSDTLKISGGNEYIGDDPSLLRIKGTCNMYPGVTIADRKGGHGFGGGVAVEGGTFHMYAAAPLKIAESMPDPCAMAAV